MNYPRTVVEPAPCLSGTHAGGGQLASRDRGWDGDSVTSGVRLIELGRGNEPALAGPEAAPCGELLLHGIVFALAACVLLLASVLRVRGTEEVVMPGCALPLPGACSFKQLTGVECPGCGLTRSLICLAHGDVARAWRFNPAGMYVFVLVALQIPYRLAQMWRLRHGRYEIRWRWMAPLALGGLVLALLGQWVARLGAAFL